MLFYFSSSKFKFRCQGYLCPKWALDVSRFDVIRQVDVQFEYNLIELLPLAPTSQRSANLLTAFNPSNREYSVAVQDYPVVGVDSFFVVSISDDVTSAKSIYSNIILAHPDATPGNPGKMVLSRLLLDQNGKHLALFKDGSLYRLDLATKSFTLLANINAGGVNSGAVVTDAHIVVDGVLKSMFYNSVLDKSYVVLTDLTKSTVAVGAPVEVVPYIASSHFETPISAFQITDPNTKVSKFAVMFAGSFDQFMWVDEKTGMQEEIVYDLTNQSEGTPSALECYTSTKDCETQWLTSAYNPATNKVYFPTHQQAGGTSTTYIYELQFLENHITSIYYPYIDPDVMMNFGYSGYQWVSFK